MSRKKTQRRNTKQAAGKAKNKGAKRVIGVFGVNGFIGHHLLKKILGTTDWNVIGVDMYDSRIKEHIGNRRFTFIKADIRKDVRKVENVIKKSDVVVPLAGIATPQIYMEQPLEVFELDFEANLPIVRLCAFHDKFLIWPSTSEVYGMSSDSVFHPETSPLVVGPIHKSRWIYSTSKQLMDRIIWALGTHKGLRFSIFRPFNWTGIGLDEIDRKGKGSARVITQFLGNILRGEDIILVDGGLARRSFTYVDDCIDALMAIIEDKKGVVNGKIYNIGNPENNISIRDLAELLVEMAPKYAYFRDNIKKVRITPRSAEEYYGEGYEDMNNRIPHIDNTVTDLDWNPKVGVREMVEKTFQAYVEHFDKKK